MTVECGVFEVPFQVQQPELGTIAYNAFAGGAPTRVRLTSLNVMHLISPFDAEQFCVRVFRIVECRSGCGIGEFRYCIPLGCPPAILPPGLYELEFIDQNVSADVPGGEYTLAVLFEPVDADYVAASKSWC